MLNHKWKLAKDDHTLTFHITPFVPESNWDKKWRILVFLIWFVLSSQSSIVQLSEPYSSIKCLGDQLSWSESFRWVITSGMRLERKIRNSSGFRRWLGARRIVEVDKEYPMIEGWKYLWRTGNWWTSSKLACIAWSISSSCCSKNRDVGMNMPFVWLEAADGHFKECSSRPWAGMLSRNTYKIELGYPEFFEALATPILSTVWAQPTGTEEWHTTDIWSSPVRLWSSKPYVGNITTKFTDL